jgi:hypothetical protein
MQIAIVLYDRFTVLDAIGPYQVLTNGRRAEYDPQPPYDAGSPDRAPADLVASMRRRTG